MKILENINIKPESKSYILGFLFFVISLFLLTSVSFLIFAIDKMDVLFSQRAEVVCTYFIAIMDRILLILLCVWLLPITVIQLSAKDKSRADNVTSVCALVIFTVLVSVFLGGEFHFYKIYKSGELSNSKLFQKPTIEMKIFNKI